MIAVNDKVRVVNQMSSFFGEIGKVTSRGESDRLSIRVHMPDRVGPVKSTLFSEKELELIPPEGGPGEVIATNLVTTITGREDKPRTGSEALLIGDRVSTAPLAHDIRRLSEDLRIVEQGTGALGKRMTNAEDQIEELKATVEILDAKLQVVLDWADAMAKKLNRSWWG